MNKLRKRILLIPLAAAVMVLAILYLLATAGPGEDFIRRQAEARIGASLGVPVRIGSLETNLLTRLVVGDVLVFPDSTAAEPSISLARGVVHLLPWDLLRAQLTLSEIRLDSLRVDAIRDSTGLRGIPVPSGGGGGEAASGGGFPLKIRLGRLAVSGGELHYDDRVIRLDGVLRDLGARIYNDGEGGYNLALDAGSGSVEFRGNPIDIGLLAMRGSWRSGVLHAPDIQLDITGLAITADITLDTRQSPLALEGSITAEGNPSPLAGMLAAYIPARAVPLDGQIRLGVRFTNLIDSTRTVTAALDIDSLRTTDGFIRNAAISGTLNGDALDVAGLSGDLLGGHIDGSGTVTLAGDFDHNVTLTVSGIDLAEVLRVATGSVQPLTGTIDGTLTSRGPFDYTRLAADAELKVVNFSRAGQSIDSVEASVTMAAGALDAEVRQGDTAISVRASVNDRQLTGTIDAEIDRLRPLVLPFGLTELNATGTVHATLSGAIDQPEFEAEVDAGDGFYRGLSVSSLVGRLSYQDGQFSVEASEFKGETASVDSLVSAWGLPEAIRGGIRYSGSFSGWGADPHLELTAELDAPAWDGYAFDSGEVDLSLDVRTLTIDRAVFTRHGRPVSASAVYAIDRSRIAALLVMDASPPSPPPVPSDEPAPAIDTFVGGAFPAGNVISIDFGFGGGILNLLASGGDIPVSDLAGMYAGSDTLAVAGDLSFLAAFEGTMDQPSGAARLGILQPGYGAFSADFLDIGAHVNPDGIVLDSLAVRIQDNLSTTGGRVDFVRDSEGGISIGAGSRIRGSLRGSELQVGLLNPFLPEGFSVEGDSRYDLTWSGLVGAPQVSGNLFVDNAGVFTGDDNPFIDSLTVHLAFRDSVLNIETFDGLLQETPFSLGGTVSITGARRYGAQLALSLAGRDVIAGGGAVNGDNIDLAFRSESFDLALAQPFAQQVANLSGLLQSDVTIGGTFAGPVINGRVTVDSLGFSPPVIDERISDGYVDLRFDGGAVYLDSLAVRTGGGTIDAHGSLDYHDGGIAGLDVSTSVRGVTFDRDRVYTVAVNSADLRYQRENGSYLLSGDVVLDKSVLEYNVPPQLIISYIRGERGQQTEPPAILRQTRMSILLRGGDQLWVDNNLANIRLHPELEFAGTLAEPNVTGRLTVDEGYILYLDRRFQVTRGVVDFVSRERIQPVIEFNALANIEGSQTFGGDAYTVTFEMSGPIDEATVRLTSEPQLSQSDIVSLLTFGATGEQLAGRGQDNATVRTILADRISKLGSEQLSMYVSRELSDLLGIDKVSIQGDLFAFGNSWGPQLVASEQINDRLEVTYTTNVGQLNQQGVRLDYKLSKFFSVEGHTNQTGQSGVDLKYSLKFK